MRTKNVMATGAKTAQEDAPKLLKQHGCGPIQFMGDDGLYERHLLFDNVKDLAAVHNRERYEAFARSFRDVLSQRWVLTEKTYESQNPKRVLFGMLSLVAQFVYWSRIVSGLNQEHA